MIYTIGFVGFVGGFAIGQWLLLRLLRDIPAEELLNNPTIKWKYGILNWAIAGAVCYLAVESYHMLAE